MAGQKLPKREKYWALLNHLRTVVEGPWMCIGDFNAILHVFEKLSKQPCHNNLVDSFHNTLDSYQLKDLGYHGYPYT